MTLLAPLSYSAALPGVRVDVLVSRIAGLSRRTTAAQAGYATSALIAFGILISIVTTPDPLWWQLHFSRLGTFAMFSGYVFNATIVVAGASVVYFATRLRVEMMRHAGSALLTSRRAAAVVPILVGIIGVHLSMVGIFPLNINEFMHDRGPQGALLAFVVILFTRRWMLRGMHPSVARTTRRIGVTLTLSITGFAAGLLNLAAFELLVFSLMFLWFLMLARNIGRPAETPAPASAGSLAVRAPRRPRRHSGLHASPPRVVRAASTRPGRPSVGTLGAGSSHAPSSPRTPLRRIRRGAPIIGGFCDVRMSRVRTPRRVHPQPSRGRAAHAASEPARRLRRC